MPTPNNDDTAQTEMLGLFREEFDLDTVKEAVTVSVCDAIRAKAVGSRLVAQLVPVPDELVQEVEEAVSTVIDEMIAKAAAKPLREAADGIASNLHCADMRPKPEEIVDDLRRRADRIENGVDR